MNLFVNKELSTEHLSLPCLTVMQPVMLFVQYQPQFSWSSRDISFPHDCVSSMSSNREPYTEIAVEIAAGDFKREVKKNEYDEVYPVRSVRLCQ
ncbi:uncharacterized protein CCR75_007341 [Bremia lactucae]|uniref:Uncharacterized protein n=1 Tax=Bremia lactucae TaxID=4779 RepID=A0A976IB21_BRELC|nr:hypothetical protein CCR75_007341 [Bremia lactucae]